VGNEQDRRIMTKKTAGIIVNGATGRLGSTQHIANALAPIRAEGGLPVGNDEIVPKLLFVGRDANKLERLARKFEADWSTDLDVPLGDPTYEIFCDTAATRARPIVLSRAIAAGKHVYAEKPLASSVAEGLDLLNAAEARGVKAGAVEDKLFLPGFQKLAKLLQRGFFGRIIGFRLEFGWWVFDGTEVPCQRPSWNYQKVGGGGLVFDMYPHWRYVLEGLLGPIARVVSAISTGVPERIDEKGQRYRVDVEDSAHTLVTLESGAIGVIWCSWATRVRRDDLLTLQIDGTNGSALTTLHRCFTQLNTQAPHTHHFNVAVDSNIDYCAHWTEASEEIVRKNPYRFGWEAFLRHVYGGEPMHADFAKGIRDVQLAEACIRSIETRAWVGMEKLAT
jgi:predicted dehydrogenase